MERGLESPGPRIPKAMWSLRTWSLSREQIDLGLISQEADTEVYKWFLPEKGLRSHSVEYLLLPISWTTHVL